MAVRMGVAERRARLAIRHHLAPAYRFDDVSAMTGALVALHATDPATVYLGARARLQTPTVGLIERGLYEDRTLVRMLGMRRTMFIVPVELVPVVYAACTLAIAVTERRKTEKFLLEAGVTDHPREWLADVEGATVAALAVRGEALSTELSAEVPDLAKQIVLARGKSYEASQSVASRVLPLLAADGRVVRGRPRGSWTSGQYLWSTIEAWLPGGLVRIEPATARIELARRWLTAFGPAPVSDLKWWSGWTLGQTRAALAALNTTDVDLDGEPGIVLTDDVATTSAPAPFAAFLPGLDPSVMGWQSRGWFLGVHTKQLFDTNGNAGPTIWWDGRVVGGWSQRKDGEVVYRLLEDVGSVALEHIEAEADRLQNWIGPIRVTPRFRTPLERLLG